MSRIRNSRNSLLVLRMILKEAKNDTLSKRIRLSLKEKWTGISGMTGIVAEKTSSTSRRNSHHEKIHIHRITRFRKIKEERI